jgi:LCP family protein required for cell wall assembly
VHGWLRELAVALLAPGWQERSTRRALGIVLLAVGVVVPLAVVLGALVSGRGWVALSLDAGFLAWLMVAISCALVARIVAVAVWFRRTGAAGRDRAVAAGVAFAMITVPLGVGFVSVARARADIAPVFTPSADGPLYDADAQPPSVTAAEPLPRRTTTTPPTTVRRESRPTPTIDVVIPTTTTTTLPPLPERPDSGVDPARLADVYNVLLLGGDAGPGRSGLRTDTMMLLSVHTPSGRASLVSLPRDMKGLLFPPESALGQRYPYGFTELANAVYPVVSSNDSLRAAYDADGIRPGVVATAEAIGYSLDVTIHDYVLVDMQGFLDLVDALGGVTVTVSKQIPMPGNIPGASQYPETIGPGTVHMNGSTALGYARSRYADSDFQRTARQRALLAALARQVSFTDVVGNYGGVTSAIGGTLRTSLTPDELANTLALIGGETAIVESVGLVPPLTSITRPDFQKLAEVVGAVRVAIAEGTDSGY